MDFAIYNFDSFKIKIVYEKETVFQIIKLENEDEIGIKNEFSELVYLQLKEYFSGKRKEFSFNYSLSGSDFEINVWKEILKIPYGKTKSYKEISKNILNEKAYRAVGNASNKNKLLFVIPCHRVIKSNGDIGEYVLGREFKEYLLNLEKK